MPGERKISAGEVAKDIRSGMTDAELMEKYMYCFRQVKEKKVLVVDFSHVGFFGV